MSGGGLEQARLWPCVDGYKKVEVAENARSLGMDVDIVPALTDLVSGRATATQIRPIELEDLLGRETVDLNFDNRNVQGMEKLL